MKNIFKEISETEASISSEPRNPHFRYQLGSLYFEFKFSEDFDLISEYMTKARDEFVYCLSIDRSHIRAWCGLAFAEQELLRERKNNHKNSQYEQEGHAQNPDNFDEEEFLQQMNLERYDNIIQLVETINRIASNRQLTADECADISLVLRPYNEESRLYMERARLIEPVNKKVLEHDADQLMIKLLFEQAIEKYRQAVELNPEDYELRYWFMLALDNANMHEEASEQSSMRRELKRRRFARKTLQV